MSGILVMKLRCKKWCKEYGIPEERVNLKFWLGVSGTGILRRKSKP